MDKLRAGIKRFQSETFAPNRERYERLATSQFPYALFITCGDSRVQPEVLTQSGPGEIFVERNPGNIVPAFGAADPGGVSASIEFAISVLHVSEIVICGHSDCGAMKAVLNPGAAAHLNAVNSWLRYAKPAYERNREELAKLTAPAQLKRLIELNVVEQLRNLKTHPCVIANPQLNLHGWSYEIHSGKVSALDAQTGRFEALV